MWEPKELGGRAETPGFFVRKIMLDTDTFRRYIAVTMDLRNTPHTLMTPEAAEAAAKLLKANDPEWNYIVRHDPTGRGHSFIEVEDEDGIIIGRI